MQPQLSGRTGPNRCPSLEDRPRPLHTSLYAYIATSLLTGGRTEELRALRWAKGPASTRRPGLRASYAHSFVSLLSSSGVRIEDIADLCGHAGTAVTEKVYRHQLRLVLLDVAIAMDQIVEADPGQDG